MTRARLSIALALTALALSAASASAAGLAFGPLQPLPGSLPGTDQRQGGEPSLTFDPRGQLAYAASPGAPDHGGNFWRSTDGGATYGPGISVGSMFGGGDSDIAVDPGPQHTVYNVDLEDLVASDLCRSTDEGQSFPADGCDTGFTSNQVDPAVDRPWVTTVPGKPGLVYDTYDGLAFGGGAPEVAVSTDGGSAFLPCGQVLEPGSSAFAHFSPTGALENSETIGKPAVDGADGTLYVPFTEPHTQGQQVSEPTNPTDGNLYVGIAQGGCSPGSPATFQDVPVYENDAGRAGFSNIFPSVSVDGAGNVYVLGTGKLRADQDGEGVYLFVSRDHGLHWSPPIQVDSGPAHAAQLGALAAGLQAGQAFVGWYESTTTKDSADRNGRWVYKVAETLDFGGTFDTTTITPEPYHYGEICNLGIECGLIPGAPSNRNLLDFTSVAVNPVSGCAAVVIPGDPFDTPDNGKTDAAAAYSAVQTGGPCLAQQAAVAGETAQGHHKHKRRHHRHRRRHHRRAHRHAHRRHHHRHRSHRA